MNEPRPAILLVEDDAQVRRVLRTTLGIEGYRVIESETGRRAMIDAGSHKPDLAIVDLGLPDFDGVEVIRGIREWSAMPIVVLSARALETSKIQALDAGATDYVTKPFSMPELLARIRAALRWSHRPSTGKPLVKLGAVSVDFERRTASRGGAELHLTPIEFRLLAVLAKQTGMVVTHRQLLTQVWGPTHARDTHYLRVYMKQLREKLESDPVRPRYLLTDTGVGYRLLEDG
jgi:two-component system, OmpR family, KDP operon response regulator KdpE